MSEIYCPGAGLMGMTGCTPQDEECLLGFKGSAFLRTWMIKISAESLH